MRCIFRLIVYSFLLLVGKYGMAQHHINDTIHQLKGIEISTDRFFQNISGVKVEKIDSNSLRIYNNSNLSELISQRSPIYIKSNGVSGLSSVSIRGTGTSHTAIIWNGFNIQSSMNGGMDISLVPVSFIDKISIQYNGMAALYGSGAIGGAIHLQNEPEFNKGFKVSMGGSYGSFQNYSGNFNVSFSTNKTVLSLKGFYHEGMNDFPFTNYAKYGSPKVKQTNSKLSQYGAIMDDAYKINSKNKVSLCVWLQESKRQIPTVMTQEFSHARQDDDILRTTTEWVNNGNRYKLFVRTALLIDDYRYVDTDKLINSASGTTASVSESEIYFKLFPDHTMDVGIHYKYTSGFCDYYTKKQSQQETSAFISYTATNKTDKWKLNIGLREEYSDNKFVPLLPSVAMDIRLYKEMFVYFNFSRNYRIPTLNDLYWFPGGNPDLKPENGYAEEIGIKHNITFSKIKLNYVLSGFNDNVKNWIVWLPKATYWSPQNIQAVWSRGGEANLGIDVLFSKCRLGINSAITYVNSITEKSDNRTSIGKQLIYTPKVNSNVTINLEYRKFLFSYNMEYVSTRFTSPDNSETIKPYLLGNLQVSKDFQVKTFSFNVFCHFNNLWNTNYQTVVWQAMPGFNFKVGFQINFKPNLKKSKK